MALTNKRTALHVIPESAQEESTIHAAARSELRGNACSVPVGYP